MNIDYTDPNWKDFNYYYNLDTKIQDNYISNIKMQMIDQQQKAKKIEIKQLFEFIENWKSKYDLFCHEFDCYTYTESRMPIWSCNSPIEECGYFPLPKSEFYIDEFFNMILNKRAKFEIQQNRQNYNPEYDRSGRIYEYSKQPDQNIIISGNKFTIIGKDNNYRLDIKMNAALICSLIGAISNNIVVHQWYSRQSRFKEFIDNMAKSHYYVEFGGINSRQPHALVSGSQNEPTLCIDFDGRWLYFILPNEILRVENMVHYNHLDKIFGPDRTKPLTEEDLQLYSILNEGRKPIMYDFEY